MLNVDADTPLALQGDMVDNPSPAPKATRSSVKAAAATAPATIAAHDTPVTDGASTIVAAERRSDSMKNLPAENNCLPN